MPVESAPQYAQSRCTTKCIIIKDLGGEHFCLAHGTIVFVRQVWDGLEESDVQESNVYSTRFLLTAYRTSQAIGYPISELARDLGISPDTIERTVNGSTSAASRQLAQRVG